MCSRRRSITSGTRRSSLNGADAVVVPGGFSYGDYLRCGAIARFSPDHARGEGSGGAGQDGARHLQRLPDSLRSGPAAGRAGAQHQPPFPLRDDFGSRRASGQPIHERISDRPGLAPARSRTAKATTSPTMRRSTRSSRTSRCSSPIATPRAAPRPESNPNGSQRNIAGITNRAGNVLGLMPHPERASEKILGSDDGLGLFESILAARKAGEGDLKIIQGHKL